MALCWQCSKSRGENPENNGLRDPTCPDADANYDTCECCGPGWFDRNGRRVVFDGDRPLPSCACHGADDRHRCPRRVLEFGPWQRTDWDTWREDDTCSFCGSLRPEKFFELVEAGEEVIPTDKSYKAYVGKYKVYFQHFDDQDQQRFIDLYNRGRMNIAYPGYFYKPPYFIVFDRRRGSKS